MADPLAIATGKDKGFATVLPESTVNYYELKLKRQAAEAKKAEDARVKEQKVKNDLFQTMNDLEITGFIPQTQQLNEEKIAIQKHLTDKYMQNQNYNPNVDSEFAKKFGEFKLHNKISTDIKDWHKSEWAKLQASKDIWDTTSAETLTSFFKMPIADATKYIEKYGFPQLTPKKAAVDYDAEIVKLVPDQSSQTVEVPQPDGTTKLTSVSKADTEAMKSIAQRFADAGFKGTNEKAVALIGDLKSQFSDDAQYKLLDDAEKDQFIKAKAYEYTLKGMQDAAAKSVSQTLQGAAGGKGGFSFGGGTTMQNDKIAVSYAYDSGKDTEIFTFDDIKTPENRLLTFKVKNEKGEAINVEGTPLRYEKKGGVVPTLVISVKEKAPFNGKETLKEYSVNYNQAADKVKNNYGFNPYEIIEGLKLQGVKVRGTTTTTKKAEGKTISMADAKKANPTFKGSDADLVAKYKAYGYTVK
jgi:hypothetical protein